MYEVDLVFPPFSVYKCLWPFILKDVIPHLSFPGYSPHMLYKWHAFCSLTAN